MNTTSPRRPLQERIVDQHHRCRAASLEAARLRYLSDVACLLLKQTCVRMRVLHLVNAH